MVIPAGMTSIHPITFTYVFGLTNIQVDSANPAYTSRDGLLYDKDMETLVCCPAGRQGSVEIPDGVKVIEKYGFACCQNLNRVVLPVGVQSLTKYVFYWCENLADVTLPESILFIEDGAFAQSSNLRITAPKDSYAYRWAVQNGKKLAE